MGVGEKKSDGEVVNFETWIEMKLLIEAGALLLIPAIRSLTSAL
jgi:hypothetical protein